MAQRKDLQWTQLRVGVMATVALVLLAIGIFFISGQIGFLTRHYTIKTYVEDAGGVRQGAQVQLAGIPVGNVSSIRLSSSQDPNRAVEIDMKVTTTYQSDIRSDSVASTVSAGLLGEKFVQISRGTSGHAVVPEGGEIKSHQEADIKEVVQNANDVISNLRVLSGSLNDISNQITAGQGSLGKFLYDPELYNRLTDTAGKAQILVANLQGGKGTMGQLLTDDTLYKHLVSSVDRLDNVIDNLEHGQGSMAKFINDPAVYDGLKKTVDQANVMMTKVNQGQGTLGKVINDPQLYDRLNSTATHVDSIAARMDRGEGSLGLLSTNDKLYKSLSQSADSLGEFLTEFRKDPRKYLTVRIRLF